MKIIVGKYKLQPLAEARGWTYVTPVKTFWHD